jgi:hypothetical protein
MRGSVLSVPGVGDVVALGREAHDEPVEGNLRAARLREVRGSMVSR